MKLITALGLAALSTQSAQAKDDTPYSKLPNVPSFALTSADVKPGERLKSAQMSGIFGAGGQDASPQLAWSGFPKTTKSFAITVFDPDAPTGSGFWHWAVADLPVATTSLPEGAGVPNSTILPKEAIQFPNDAGMPRFLGAAPPAGSGKHRYFITVYALDVPSLGIPANSTPAVLGFSLTTHAVARASLVGWAEQTK